MLGEDAGGSESQQPPTVSCLSHLAHRQVLQPEQFAGPAREPQASGGERQPSPSRGEQPVLQLFAQVGDVDGHCCLGDTQVSGGTFD